MRIGIMQGRLVPPVNDRIQAFPVGSWEIEFRHAQEVGLDSIEWIFEVFAADENPFSTDAGLAQINEVSKRFEVKVRSLCADYFMDRPLLRATRAEQAERIDTLRWIIGRCAAAGIERVVLPFVDASGIRTLDEMNIVVDALTSVVPTAESHAVELHLETSLPPNDFAALLSRLPHPLIRVNYDSGNSASLGFDAGEEFAAYGARIGSVHIKDRVRGGGTVPLGTGDADFKGVFQGLREVGFDRDFVLQVARGPVGDEVAWARQNQAFLRSLTK